VLARSSIEMKLDIWIRPVSVAYARSESKHLIC
jgi:hypothetical protein